MYFLWFVFKLPIPVQVIAWKSRLRNDLLCIKQDVELLTHTHSPLGQRHSLIGWCMWCLLLNTNQLRLGRHLGWPPVSEEIHESNIRHPLWAVMGVISRGSWGVVQKLGILAPMVCRKYKNVSFVVQASASASLHGLLEISCPSTWWCYTPYNAWSAGSIQTPDCRQ